MSKATREEIDLYLKWWTHYYSNPIVREAADWFTYEFKKMTYEEFKEKYPYGSDGYKKFHVYGYQWEMLGALAYEGHLSIQFIINSSGTSWYNKAVDVIDGIRKETKNPYRYENWTWLIKSIREYWEGHTAGKARYE